MEKKIMDMHMHSIHSDGCNTPQELVNIAKESNISTIALTDHDNIEGSKEIVKLKDQGIYIYSGVELTAKVPKGRMHILGYNIDLENEKINKRLHEMKEAAIYNMYLYRDILKKDFSLTIPNDKFDKIITYPGNVGRPHLAALLIELGYAKDVDEAFDIYLRYAFEKVRSVKKGLTKEECLDLILDSDGIVSLAHPCSLEMTNDELDKEVAYLKYLGMQSVEIQHIHTTLEQRAFYNELAKKYDLLISGGSDYHGINVKPDVKMGTGKNNNVYIEEGSLTLTKNIKSRYM